MSSLEDQFKSAVVDHVHELSTTISRDFTDLGKQLIADGATDADMIRAQFQALADRHELTFTEDDTLPDEFLAEVIDPDGEEFSVTFEPNIIGLD